MAKPPRLPDVERTAEMLDALRRAKVTERADAESAIVLTEVPAFSGFRQTNADAIVLNLWKAAGTDRKTGAWRWLDGFELKASKSDLKRELADGEKNAAVRRFCDTWTLLCYDEAVFDGLTIPEQWGIAVLRDGALTTVRKPPMLQPEPWTDAFIASLIRRAWHQSPGAAYVARACDEARSIAYSHGLRQGTNTAREELKHEVLAALGPNAPKGKWGGDPSWSDILPAIERAASAHRQRVG